MDTKKNRHLIKEGGREECLLSYRTTGEYWGKERAVIVTYYPRTARKKHYTFQSKMGTLRQELLSMRLKVREKAPHWRNPDTIKERYFKAGYLRL